MIDFQEILKRLAFLVGCKPTQRAVAEAIGLSEQDFHNRKKRETLAQYIANYALLNNYSLDYIFGRLPVAGPEPDNQAVILLPPWSPDPPDADERKWLAWTIDVLRSEDVLPGEPAYLQRAIERSREAVERACPARPRCHAPPPRTQGGHNLASGGGQQGGKRRSNGAG